jgi:protoheme IX farnesyltransferase
LKTTSGITTPTHAVVALPAPIGRATWRDYLALTKPRIISLLLFTTLTALFIAADSAHHVTATLFWAVAIGGYMAAGAANAINMVIDRDIDGRMARTANRPTVTQEISTRNALLFAFALTAGSFALLTGFANLLAASLALAGLAFYVIIYTLLLKRRTWHNIVIGGAAGAFPPLVGWAAVAHSLNPLAWTLFAIIFFWTPVHFWALALLIKDDYAKANIPMLPVVRGDRVTVRQIALYTVATVIVTTLPYLNGSLGGIYLVSSLALNSVLILAARQLFRQPERPQAFQLFKYSMLYLALLFLMMAVDRVILHR